MKAGQPVRTCSPALASWKSAVVISGCLVSAFFSSPGCTSNAAATTRPSIDAQSDNAIRDPMHYSPFDGKPDMGSSGGDHLEHRTLQQDVNDVIHP